MQLDEKLIRNSKNFGASIFQRKIELKQELLSLIKEGKELPESFKNLLFPPKEEHKVCPKCKSPYWNVPRKTERRKDD